MRALLVLLLCLYPVSTSALVQASGSLALPARPLCATCRLQLGPANNPLALLRPDPTVGVLAGFLATDTGDIYLSDLSNGRVIRVDARLHTWTSVGRHGEGPGEFLLPQLTALTPKGRLVVYDPAQARLTTFGPNGRLIQAVALGVSITYVKGLLADDEFAYISGTASTGPALKHVIHKFRLTGQYTSSFGDPSTAFPNSFEQLLADGGPLQWGLDHRSLILSRGGPNLELLEFSLNGILRRHVTMRTPLIPQWTDRMRASSTNGRIAMTSLPMLGTVTTFVLADTLFFNVAALDDSTQVRYDVFVTPSLRWLASWTEHVSPSKRIAFSDGLNTVFSVSPMDGAVMAHRATLLTP